MVLAIQDLVVQKTVLVVPVEGQVQFFSCFSTEKTIRDVQAYHKPESVKQLHKVQAVEDCERLLSLQPPAPKQFFLLPGYQERVFACPNAPSTSEAAAFSVRMQGCVLHLQYVALPFVFASAPRIFRKIIVEAVGVLSRRVVGIIPYLVDFLL